MNINELIEKLGVASKMADGLYWNNNELSGWQSRGGGPAHQRFQRRLERNRKRLNKARSALWLAHREMQRISKAERASIINARPEDWS